MSGLRAGAGLRARCAPLALAMALCASDAIAAGPPGGATGAREERPLSLGTVVADATARRPEIVAAAARVAAAEQRPAIVSALEDPMVMAGIDHYPYRRMATAAPGDEMTPQPMPAAPSNGRFDWSVSVEQRFPLSRVRTYRRAGAEAETRQRRAEAGTAGLDVAMSAVEAFVMTRERRRLLEVARARAALADQLADLSAIKLATATGGQADVLRAEVEVARSRGEVRGLAGEVAEAEAMLNAAIARAPGEPVPALSEPALPDAPPALDAALATARQHRPELRGGEAEIARAAAEVDVMKSMFAPMGLVRVGQASTMAEGRGAMLMVGVSVPLGRARLRAGVDEARSMEAMARADLDAMRLMVDAEVAAARQRVLALRARFDAFRADVLPRTRTAVQSSLAAYGAGTGTLEAVVDALRQQWMAEGEVVMAESELMLAWARLDRAQGRAPGTALAP